MRYSPKYFILLFMLFSIFYPLSSILEAAIPRLINYQGRLTDSREAPLNGAYSLTFRIYDSQAAGNLLWEEAHSNVIIQKGIFSVLLGSVTNLSLTFDRPYYLEIKVGDEVMSPRQQITASGYAIRAEKAESVDGTVKATGGLTIETRTSDPSPLATGQFWLRTDL